MLKDAMVHTDAKELRNSLQSITVSCNKMNFDSKISTTEAEKLNANAITSLDACVCVFVCECGFTNMLW